MENLADSASHGLLMDRCELCELPVCDCRACRGARLVGRVCDACELARADYFAAVYADGVAELN